MRRRLPRTVVVIAADSTDAFVGRGLFRAEPAAGEGSGGARDLDARRPLEQRRRREVVGLELDTDEPRVAIEVEVDAPGRSVLVLSKGERFGDTAFPDGLEVEVSGSGMGIMLDAEAFTAVEQPLGDLAVGVLELDADQVAGGVEVQVDPPSLAVVVVVEVDARRDRCSLVAR